MSILSWNARGLGSPRAFDRLRRLLRTYSPGLVFLSETKLWGKEAERVKQFVGFDNGFHVDCIGRSGGLIILWRKTWDVSIRNYSRHHIDMVIKSEDGFSWRFTGIYGDPERASRHYTWDLLRRLNTHLNIPWVCGGDFNEFLHLNEKKGGLDPGNQNIEAFRKVLEECKLDDLGFSGPKLTWDNRREEEANIQERLDRFVANEGWCAHFVNRRVFHHDFWGSDHRVLRLVLDNHQLELSNGTRQKSFTFEPFWVGDRECKEVIMAAWPILNQPETIETFETTLAACSADLVTWSKQKYGHVPTQLRNTIKKLALANNGSRSAVNLANIRKLEKERDRLLFLDEEFWRQRSRADWLKGGDRNSKFFHAKANQRRDKKQIVGLEDESGRWCEDMGECNAIIQRYFTAIFQTNNPSVAQKHTILDGIQSRISEEVNELLMAYYSDDEIQKAVFDMGPTKAPGPDGFHALFYQKYWSVVGGRVTILCRQFLSGELSIGPLNSTNIVLIPKVKSPKKVSDFRPISLCNVIYKIVTKCLANRLKSILPSIIHESQSAFVPGRLITDNTIAAFELMNSLRRKTGGKKGWVALKLDMSKAYDRVKWGFLAGMMRKMGFHETWIEVVMDCVCTAKLSFMVNGTSHGRVTPSRGLRQGCPLSPYLFLLCAEGLSSLLLRAEAEESITGFSCSHHGPRVSHLFFADDSLLFCRATLDEIQSIRAILQVYEDASGQVINLQKSSISFSPNVGLELRETILATLGVNVGTLHERYLGLPAFIGRNRRHALKNVKVRVWAKLQSWKGKLFSMGGKEILIKAVLQSIPAYSMSIFKLPISLCNEIQMMASKFWWGSTNEKQKMHWWRWDRLCRSKKEGGMGFRVISDFNQALLAKQGWRLLKYPNALMTRIIKAKYYPRCSLMEAKMGHNSSMVWQSIIWGRDVLKMGLRWRVGSGNTIRAFRDPWLPRPVSFQPITRCSESNIDLKVADLICAGHWDMDMLKQHFLVIDHETILSIPLGNTISDDVLVWHYDKKGCYSVKSGYKLLTDAKIVSSSSSVDKISAWWSFLWALKIPNKVRVFIWRAFNEILPTSLNLSRRGISCSGLCSTCRDEIDSTFHALLSCSAAEEVWRNSIFQPVLSRFSQNGVADLLYFLKSELPRNDFELWCITAWFVWHNRNTRAHGGVAKNFSTLLEDASTWWYEYDRLSTSLELVHPYCKVSRNIGWKPPAVDRLKLNVDAAVTSGLGFIGIGGVVRNSKGWVVAAIARQISGFFDPFLAECIALRECLQFCCDSNVFPDFVETDSTRVIEAIRDRSLSSVEGPIISDVFHLFSLLGNVGVSFIPREGNLAAHSLASYGFNVCSNSSWFDTVPACISDIVMEDLPPSI